MPKKSRRPTIIVGEKAGFCTGVRRAVELVLEAARKGGDISVYGPLVHNPQLIELLEMRGVVCERDKDKIKSGTAILRSHGVPLEVEDEFERANLKILDATCPKVKRVQKLAEKHASAGRRVLIFGDPEHAEVIAILSYAKGEASVIRDANDIESLKLAASEKVAFLAQTTQDRSKFDELAKFVKERFNDAIVEDTICNSTRERQQEIVELAKKADVVLVIGGRESGNTKRLVEIASSINPRTFWVEREEEIGALDFSNADVVAITAGASTPAWIIKGAIERVRDKLEARSALRVLVTRLVRFAVTSSVLPAVGGFFVSIAAQKVMGKKSVEAAVAVGLYLFSMYILNNFAERRTRPFKDEPAKLELYRRYGKILAILAVLAGIAAPVLVLNMGVVPLAGIVLAELFGVVYSLPVLPKWVARIFGIKRLKDIAASKSLFVAIAWCWVTILPVWWNYKLDFESGFVASALLFLLISSRAILFDLFDIGADKLVGAETLPTMIGERRTYLLLLAMLSGMGILSVALGLTGIIDRGDAIVWLVAAFSAIVLIPVFKIRFFEQSKTLKAAITDAGLIALGILSLIVG